MAFERVRKVLGFAKDHPKVAGGIVLATGAGFMGVRTGLIGPGASGSEVKWDPTGPTIVTALEIARVPGVDPYIKIDDVERRVTFTACNATVDTWSEKDQDWHLIHVPPQILAREIMEGDNSPCREHTVSIADNPQVKIRLDPFRRDLFELHVMSLREYTDNQQTRLREDVRLQRLAIKTRRPTGSW